MIRRSLVYVYAFRFRHRRRHDPLYRVTYYDTITVFHTVIITCFRSLLLSILNTFFFILSTIALAFVSWIRVESQNDRGWNPVIFERAFFFSTVLWHFDDHLKTFQTFKICHMKYRLIINISCFTTLLHLCHHQLLALVLIQHYTAYNLNAFTLYIDMLKWKPTFVTVLINSRKKCLCLN